MWVWEQGEWKVTEGAERVEGLLCLLGKAGQAGSCVLYHPWRPSEQLPPSPHSLKYDR